MSALSQSSIVKARQILQLTQLVSQWETDFIRNCLKFPNRLSKKQLSRLEFIISKYHHPSTNNSPLKRTDTIKLRFSKKEIVSGKALRFFPLKKNRP